MRTRKNTPAPTPADRDWTCNDAGVWEHPSGNAKVESTGHAFVAAAFGSTLVGATNRPRYFKSAATAMLAAEEALETPAERPATEPEPEKPLRPSPEVPAEPEAPEVVSEPTADEKPAEVASAPRTSPFAKCLTKGALPVAQDPVALALAAKHGYTVDGDVISGERGRIERSAGGNAYVGYTAGGERLKTERGKSAHFFTPGKALAALLQPTEEELVAVATEVFRQGVAAAAA